VAVVSSFRPSRHLLENLALIAAQADAVVVADDGSGPGAHDVLDAVRATGAGVVALPENQGVAAALNAGLDAADLGPDDLAVMFDQDSSVPHGFISALVTAWDAGERAGLRMGMVSPERFAGVPQTAGGVDADGCWRSVEPIQSGSLVSGRVLAETGGLQADLFIDLVDKEYWLRLRRHGRECLAVPGLDLPHERGRTYALTLAGRVVRPAAPLTFSISMPFRYYYRVRNRVVVNREYWRDHAGLLTRDTLLEVRHLVLVWLSAQHRGAFLRVVARGLRDGLCGRMGRMPDDVARLAAGIRWRINPLR